MPEVIPVDVDLDAERLLDLDEAVEQATASSWIDFTDRIIHDYDPDRYDVELKPGGGPMGTVAFRIRGNAQGVPSRDYRLDQVNLTTVDRAAGARDGYYRGRVPVPDDATHYVEAKWNCWDGITRTSNGYWTMDAPGLDRPVVWDWKSSADADMMFLRVAFADDLAALVAWVQDEIGIDLTPWSDSIQSMLGDDDD